MTTTVIPHDVGSCSALLPKDWDNGVPGADLPPEQATIGDWEKFGNSQTSALDTANDHYKQGVGIIRRCEERDAAVTAHLTKPWWKFWD